LESTYTHPSDEELLLFADGELSSRQASQVETHLTACWDCRSRLRQIEETITDFVELHHHTLDPQLPPSAGPRALLKARLAEAAATGRHGRWLPQFRRVFAGTRLAYVGAMVLAVFLTTVVAYRFISPATPTLRSSGGTARFVPDRRLTPGVAQVMNPRDVCTTKYSDDTGVLPASVRQRVFQEYGLAGAQSNSYELDYLISPQLGGTNDIRNLWPEPASQTGWNLRAKDQLEDRLRQLVCQGNISLATAQHELATDWISAYKKYFHTDTPNQQL
jgi:hypothetical protein